jgi:cell shape-determining protein MreC
MKYRLDSSYTFTRPTKNSRTGRFLVLFVLSLVLLGGGNFIFGWFSPLAQLVAYPFLKSSTAAVSLADTTFLTRSGLVKEIERLQSENTALKAKQVLLEQHSSELSELRASYGFAPAGSNSILVRAISKPNQTPYDVVVVDAGSKNTPGLRVGQTATINRSLVIGQVVEVQALTSKVRLFSSSGLDLPVLIGQAQLPATAQGVGGGNFKVSLPRGADVVAGDIIRASAFSQYILGKVDEIEADPNQPFQTIRFRLPTNLYELEWFELHD